MDLSIGFRSEVSLYLSLLRHNSSGPTDRLRDVNKRSEIMKPLFT